VVVTSGKWSKARTRIDRSAGKCPLARFGRQGCTVPIAPSPKAKLPHGRTHLHEPHGAVACLQVNLAVRCSPKPRVPLFPHDGMSAEGKTVAIRRGVAKARPRPEEVVRRKLFAAMDAGEGATIEKSWGI
jgi:hypothetical protein